VPLFALILANAYGGLIAVLSGAPFPSLSAGMKWDAGIYPEIAEHGYYLFRCNESPPEAWCGNAGWFPRSSNTRGEEQVPVVEPVLEEAARS
jgi:hypothetical protein